MIIPVMTRKNFSSGNPGDVFILWGLQHLFEVAAKCRLEWLFLDKFSPADFRKNHSFLKEAGWMIYAGTPQYNNYDDWCLWYDWPVWQEYLIPMDISFYPIAGGSGFPKPHMTPDEFADYCLSSKKTRSILNSRAIRSGYTTVRDPHASRLLEKQGIAHDMLPCTALWSFEWLGIEPTDKNLTYLVPPSPRAVGLDVARVSTYEEVRAIVKSRFIELATVLEAQGHNVSVICHGPEEYKLFKHLDNCIYVDDAITLLRMYGDASLVISSRLHGALPAFGGGRAKVLSIHVDTRGSAVSLVGMKSIAFDDWDLDLILGEIETLEPIDRDMMIAAEKEYLKIFRDILETNNGTGS